MAKTALWAAGLVLACTGFTSAAQIFYKFGVSKLSFNFMSIITNWPIILGLALYGIGAVLLLIALRHGELSVLYPIIALSYVWVNLLAMHFFNEPINLFKWLGIAVIVLGVSFIGKGMSYGD